MTTVMLLSVAEVKEMKSDLFICCYFYSLEIQRELSIHQHSDEERKQNNCQF